MSCIAGSLARGKTVAANIPLATFVTNALFAIRDFDRPDAAFSENCTAISRYSQSKRSIDYSLVEENHLFEAESRLIALLPPEEMGRAAFSSNCAPCHGDDGTGGMGPNLTANTFVQSKSDEELVDFILSGREGTAMDGFEGILGSEEINNIIAILREWQN
jgi:cytochrome c2